MLQIITVLKEASKSLSYLAENRFMESGNIKEKLNRIVYHKLVVILDVILVIISLGLLFYQKLADITPEQLSLLDKIDFGIMILFSISFFLKLYLEKGAYFFQDYGWVDLLCILPLFSPALKAIRGIKLLRSLRLLRALKILRFLRILRIIKIRNSRLKQRMFVPVSSVIMILGLVLGFTLGLWQQGIYNGFEMEKLKEAFTEFDERTLDQTIVRYPDILVIKEGDRDIYRRFKEEEISRRFLDDYLAEAEFVITSSTARAISLKVVYSIKESYRNSQRTEVMVIFITLLIVLILFFIINRIISQIVLDPIANLTETLNKIVYEVPIPNTDLTRREINFNTRIEYESDDEVGDLAENFNFVLGRLNERIDQSRNIFRRIIDSMMNLFGEFHQITRGHQERTALIAAAIGHRMGLSEKDKITLYNGMMLHDLGKVGVDKNVLTKPGRFTDEERQEINRHPQIGYEIARDFPLITSDELAIIKEHHEKIDGTGYPAGIKGEDMHPLSRISAVADIFDALSCPRDYKTAKSFDQVKAIMDDMKGKHIDLDVYQVLLDLVDEEILKVNPSQDIDEREWITVDEKKLGGKAVY